MASFGVDDCEQFFGRKSVPSNTRFSQEKMIYVTCLTTLILCNVVYAKEGLSSEVGRTFRLLEKSVSDAVEGGSSDAIGCPFSEVSGVCSGHGNCRDGVCVCEEGYSSFDCSVRGCPQGRSFFFYSLAEREVLTQIKYSPGCSGQGECVQGVCYCFEGHAGIDCSEKACPASCNNHGTCSKGVCMFVSSASIIFKCERSRLRFASLKSRKKNAQ